jgi:hypothetical protein
MNCKAACRAVAHTKADSGSCLLSFFRIRTMISQIFSRGRIVFFCALHGYDKVIEPHEQAGELDAVDTTTYFRRYDGKRTIEERDFRDRR